MLLDLCNVNLMKRVMHGGYAKSRNVTNFCSQKLSPHQNHWDGILSSHSDASFVSPHPLGTRPLIPIFELRYTTISRDAALCSHPDGLSPPNHDLRILKA